MRTGSTIVDDYLHVVLPESQFPDSFDAAAVKADARFLIDTNEIQGVKYFLADESRWNSQTLATISGISKLAKNKGLHSDLSELPEGISKILALSKGAVNDTAGSAPAAFNLFETLGDQVLGAWATTKDTAAFLGETLQSFKRFFSGKADYQRSDLNLFIQAAGPQALLIIGIVNLLLGVILAFMGAVQLKLFGAEIFVADLVAFGHTREIAPMMTAIVIAGRTGAAYAAQLGTMQVNEEIDALKTFGFTPMDFLVLPRVLALALMMPLLVLYGDAIGIFGGYLVGVYTLDFGPLQYIVQTQNSIDLKDILYGVFKGIVFGVLVAVIGCKEGLSSGRDASAVGDAATKAVVNGILAIIVATAIFSVLATSVGI